MLARMGQFLQTVKTKKPRCPFNCMNDAKDLPHQLAVLGPYLQLGQASLHAIQTLLALRNKLFSQIVHTPLIGQSLKIISPADLPSPRSAR